MAYKKIFLLCRSRLLIPHVPDAREKADLQNNSLGNLHRMKDDKVFVEHLCEIARIRSTTFSTTPNYSMSMCDYDIITTMDDDITANTAIVVSSH